MQMDKSPPLTFGGVNQIQRSIKEAKKALKVYNSTIHQLKVPLPAKISMSKDSTDALPIVNILGYTGASVDLSDYGIDDPVVYLMEGIEPSKGKIPYLLNHSVHHPLGHTTSVTKANGELRTTAIHSYPSQESRDVAGAIANGMPYEASMGLEISLDSVVYHDKGSIEANGRTFNAPIYTIGKSKLVEMSATLFGRDGDTEVTKLSKETLTMIKNNKPGESPAKDEDKKDSVDLQTQLDNAKKELEAKKVELAKKAESDKKELDKKELDNKKPEDKKEIPNGGIPKTDLLRVVRWMNSYKDHPELVETAIDNGWDEDRLKREVEIKRIENGYPSLPSAWIPNADKKDQTFLARLALSVGLEPEFIEKKLGKPSVDNALSQGHMGLAEGLTIVANQHGGRFTGHSDTQQLSKHLKRLHLNNAFSTIDYPNLMHQVSKWKMEAAWMLDPPFAPSICKPLSNKDFRPTGHIKPKGGTMWNGLNQEGKIDHGSFGKEDKYQTSLGTVAQMLTFKREDIINDDIGWIAETLDLMVEGATMVPDYQLVNLIYNALAATVIVDGTSKFALALTAANLNTVYEAIKLRNVTKGDKAVKVRNQTKQVLVVAPSLEKAAWEIINQDRFVQGPTGEFVGERNYWKDRFEVKVFDQLSNTTYHSGAKVGTWGIVPMNTTYAPFAITYLNGQTKPTTETVDLPADELGWGMRGYWDVNLDYRPVENNQLQATAWSFPS